jgi:hypothetical protein
VPVKSVNSTGGLMELIQKIVGAIKDIKNQVQHKYDWKGKYKAGEVLAYRSV